jgi:hypothetical protein
MLQFPKMNKFEIITLNKPNITDFSKERNILLKKAKSEWVLFLDSDEKLSKELEKEISDLEPKDCDGFIIKRKIIFLGKVTGEDKVIRLVKRNSGKWVRAVHETWQTCRKARPLDGYIIHNTAENLHGYIDKMNKYSVIHAKENLREGKTSSLFKIIFYPKLKFVENIASGRGFVFSMLQSFHSFLAWANLWLLTRNTGQAK